MVRFEPDSVSVDDANDRNGNAEASCCYRGDAIKGTVRRRIENLIAPYCGNALGFVFRNDVHIRRSEEHTSELQSLMLISYAVFCLKKKNTTHHNSYHE